MFEPINVPEDFAPRPDEDHVMVRVFLNPTNGIRLADVRWNIQRGTFSPGIGGQHAIPANEAMELARRIAEGNGLPNFYLKDVTA